MIMNSSFPIYATWRQALGSLCGSVQLLYEVRPELRDAAQHVEEPVADLAVLHVVLQRRRHRILSNPLVYLLPMLLVLQMHREILCTLARTRSVQFARTVLAPYPRQPHPFNVGRRCCPRGNLGSWVDDDLRIGVYCPVLHGALKEVMLVGLTQGVQDAGEPLRRGRL